jgi:hypothetical protein
MDGRPFSLRQDVESETPARTSGPGGGEALRHEPRSGYPYAGGTADVFATRVADEGFPPRTSANARPQGEPANKQSKDYPTDLSPTPLSSEATLAARRADNH